MAESKTQGCRPKNGRALRGFNTTWDNAVLRAKGEEKAEGEE
jgi:hypothetical protein